MKTQSSIYVVLFLLGVSLTSQAQYLQSSSISTAVPFLTVTPDARASAMGECGVATSPDAFSMFSNPAKYAFMSNDHTMIASGFNLFSTLVADQYLLYDAFAQKIGNSAIAASARYYSSGEIEYRDEYNQSLGTYRPIEFAVDVAYSYRISDYLSAGVAGRFIHSTLDTDVSGYNVKSSSIACDVSAYYKRPLSNLVDMSLGAAITNIGTKMAYDFSGERRNFIPTTLRFGSGFKFNFHPKNTLTVNLEFNKLLVPTPPIVARDYYGNPMYNDDGSYQILYGMDNNVSVFRGMFQSFYDAPGYGYDYYTGEFFEHGKLYEELCEINTGIGLEYNLANHFYARSGYYNQPSLKGNRKYVAIGAGMFFGIFGMDMTYTIPINIVVAGANPYSNTFQWDMYFAF